MMYFSYFSCDADRHKNKLFGIFAFTVTQNLNYYYFIFNIIMHNASCLRIIVKYLTHGLYLLAIAPILLL